VTTLRVLRLLTTLLKRRVNLSMRLSAWLWAVLCKVPDVGTLDSEQVGVVRELGKRAVWVRCGWAGGDIAESTEGLGPGVEEEGAVEELDVIAASLVDGEVADGDEEGQLDDERGVRSNSSSPLLKAASEAEEGEIDGILQLDGGNDEDAVEDAAKGKLERGDEPVEFQAKIKQQQQADLDSAQDKTVDEPDFAQRNVDDNEDAGAGANTLLRADYSEAAGVADAADAKASAAGMTDSSPNANTCATLDMLITVAGDLYGQRDLLEFREVWGEEEAEWS